MSNFSVNVSVTALYVADQSDPDNRRFTFAYTISIINGGSELVQLIARHWQIADGDGKVQEVRGLGVVGKQPLLQSGEKFEYTSWASLSTPTGTMKGEYFCVTDQAEFFEVQIPEFMLTMPRTLH